MTFENVGKRGRKTRKIGLFVEKVEKTKEKLRKSRLISEKKTIFDHFSLFPRELTIKHSYSSTNHWTIVRNA